MSKNELKEKYLVVGSTCIIKEIYHIFHFQVDDRNYIQKDTLKFTKQYQSRDNTFTQERIEKDREEFLFIIRLNYGFSYLLEAKGKVKDHYAKQPKPQLEEIEVEMLRNFIFCIDNFVDRINGFTFEDLLSRFFMSNTDEIAKAEDKFILCRDIYSTLMDKNSIISVVLSIISRSDTENFRTLRLHQRRVNRKNGLVDRSIIVTAMIDGKVEFIQFDQSFVNTYKLTPLFISNANGNAMRLIQNLIDNDLELNIYKQDQVAMRESIRMMEEGDSVEDITNYYRGIINDKAGDLKYYCEPKTTYYRRFEEADRFGGDSELVEQLEVKISVIKYNRSEDQIFDQIKKDSDLIKRIAAKSIAEYNERDSQSRCKYTFEDLDITRFIYRSDGIIEMTLVPKGENEK